MEKLISLRNNRGYTLVKMKAEMEDMLNLNFYASTSGTVNSLNAATNFIRKFNLIVWDVKVNRVFPEIDNFEGEDKIEYIRDSIEECFRNETENLDIPYQEINSIDYMFRFYKTDQKLKLKQLDCFNGMPIPEKTKSFVQDYLNTVESIELTKNQLKSIYTQYAEPIREFEEYVIYIGDNEKYKGLVGKIIQHRDDVAPNLVEFINAKGEGTVVKYWSKESNLVRFLV